MSSDSGSIGTTTASAGTTAGDTSIRVVIFSGKHQDWESWKEKFMVKAAIRGYESILLGEDKVPPTHDNKGVKKTLSTEETALATSNKTGFGDLILSIDCTTSEGKVAFAAVKGSKTVENPTGNLFAAFTRLKQKYEPQTTPQLVELTREFHSKILGKNQDPDQFITDLEALKVKMAEMKHEITDKALILHVMNSLTDDYEINKQMLQFKMQTLQEQGKELTIDHVRIELREKYTQLKRAMKEKPRIVDHAYYMGVKFKGKCNYCGKIGHKSTECRLRISGRPKPKVFGNISHTMNTNGHTNPKRENLFCTYCNKKGHDITECRKKKREDTSKLTEANTKELACMAKVLKKDNTDSKIGTCMACGRWGTAYTECDKCGEDSGCIFIPDPNEDYSNSDNNPNDSSSEATDESYHWEDISKVYRPKIIKCEDQKHVFPFVDHFTSVPIEDLFDEVYEHIKTDEDRETYIKRQHKTMHMFHYFTIPVIIKNYDNINFNIRAYNELYLPQIKPSQRPPALQIFSHDEIHLIIKWGVNLLQEYARDNLKKEIKYKDLLPSKYTELPDDPITEFTPTPSPLPPTITQEDTTPDDDQFQDASEPDEFCFMMKSLKWNFHLDPNTAQETTKLTTEYQPSTSTSNRWFTHTI